MWTRLFLTTLCILSVLATRPSLAADATAGLDLQLWHYMDSNCDGVSERDKHARAVPGSCIIYEITALNNNSMPLQNVWISAAIPEHTVLQRDFRDVHNGKTLNSTIVQHTQSRRLIKTQLDTLQSGKANKAILQYSVRIQ